MDGTLITIGSLDIKWYSVLILVGVIIGITMATREGKRAGISKDFTFNLCFWSIIIGFIGARLYYVLFNFEIYQNNLLDIFKVWEGGLAIHGGLIFGGITAILYANKYGANKIRMLDIAVVPVLLAQAIGRWGNFFNQEAHGAVTTLGNLQDNFILPNFVIEGMKINGLYYEPLFFYESLWCLLGVVILMIVRRLKSTKIGQLTSIYAIWYGIGRFVIEAGRTDSLMLGGFKVAQIVSIILIVVGILAYMILSRKGRFEDLYNEKESKEIKF